MRIGSLRPSRYGRTHQNNGLETYFTTTNSECEQIGIKTHNFVIKKKVNKMHWKKYGALVKSISTLILTCHLGIIQKMTVKARKGKGKGNKLF